MLPFDPQDPFPLVEENYAWEKVHSAELDRWLGLRVPEAEASIHPLDDGQERWLRQGPDVFLTPYTEIRRMLEELRPQAGDTVVDLGAGYGRMGYVLDRHFPDVRFLGYELVTERVRAGHIGLVCADLLRVKPEPARFYFIYDYGTRSAIEKTLGDLREIAGGRAITVVGRGRAVRDAIERGHPWLGAVVEPKHHAHYSVYRSSRELG